jgi:hypothetical protein
MAVRFYSTDVTAVTAVSAVSAVSARRTQDRDKGTKAWPLYGPQKLLSSPCTLRFRRLRDHVPPKRRKSAYRTAPCHNPEESDNYQLERWGGGGLHIDCMASNGRRIVER